ncbi:hypothetical protein [Leyella stercorea]|uniref:hypothetical protein n=2 Tax=Leyella stercorea TaxID=363265 RepID=UPI003AB0C104
MIRIDRRRCLRRPMRMSAPTDADVCADRCGCLRRPMRMSASTDADVCADRCGWYQHLITSPQHHLFTISPPHHLTTSTSYPLRCE